MKKPGFPRALCSVLQVQQQHQQQRDIHLHRQLHGLPSPFEADHGGLHVAVGLSAAIGYTCSVFLKTQCRVSRSGRPQGASQRARRLAPSGSFLFCVRIHRTADRILFEILKVNIGVSTSNLTLRSHHICAFRLVCTGPCSLRAKSRQAGGAVDSDSLEIPSATQ